MARGVNKVILIGNLGQDPETRYMPSGGAVTNVTLATSESYKDKQTGQNVERTEWHKVVFFNRLAEIAGEYCRKGSKVYIEGSLRTRKYQDKQTGQDRYSTEIVASEMQMLDGRAEGQQGGGYQQNQQQDYRGHTGSNDRYQQQGNQQQSRRPAPPPQGQPQGTYQQGANPAPMGGFDSSFDDDIPF